jgi:hypothetical protein
MSNYLVLDLIQSISSHEGWNSERPFVEIIANAVDAQRDAGKPLSGINILVKCDRVIISDEGSGLEVDGFIQGNSTKGDTSVGIYGDGLRGSVSRLLSEGYKLKIETSHFKGNIKTSDRKIFLYHKLNKTKTLGTKIIIFFPSTHDGQTFTDTIIPSIRDSVFYLQPGSLHIENVGNITVSHPFDGKNGGNLYYKGFKVKVGKSRNKTRLSYNVEYDKGLDKLIRSGHNTNREIGTREPNKIFDIVARDCRSCDIRAIFENEVKGGGKFCDMTKRERTLDLYKMGNRTWDSNVFFHDKTNFIEIKSDKILERTPEKPVTNDCQPKPTIITIPCDNIKNVNLTNPKCVIDDEIRKALFFLERKGFSLEIKDTTV